MQSRRTLEIVHNFGRALHYGPHLHVYNLFAATMADEREDEVESWLTLMPVPKMQRCCHLASQDVFVDFKRLTDGVTTAILRIKSMLLS